VPSEKRRRKKEGHRARLEAARAAARRAQRRRQATTVGTLLALLLLVFVGVAYFGDKDTAKATTEAPASTAAPYGTGECAPTSKPATVPTTFAAAPRNCLKDGVAYKAVITTTEGAMTVALDPTASAVAVNNFVNLARWGWFDGEGFHRVVPGFVDQAGNAAGRGNPGYKIPDQLPSSLDAYPKGTLAMANAGPDTGGSQWFVCIDCSKLPSPAYAVFGHVIDGLGVADAINALGAGDGPPSKPVTINSVEIIEG
jgi:cyclophilin family peptidyl-prolyl cis-trans isomerase